MHGIQPVFSLPVGRFRFRGAALSTVAHRAPEALEGVILQDSRGVRPERIFLVHHAGILETRVTGDAAVDGVQARNDVLVDANLKLGGDFRTARVACLVCKDPGVLEADASPFGEYVLGQRGRNEKAKREQAHDNESPLYLPVQFVDVHVRILSASSNARASRTAASRNPSLGRAGTCRRK